MILSFGMVIAGSGGQDGKGRTHSDPQFQVKEIIIKNKLKKFLDFSVSINEVH